MDVWTANNQRTGEIDAVKGGLSGIHYPVTSVCGKTGDVTLTAGDVGALAADGTASDSSKLGGRTWAERLLDIYPVGSIYMSVASTSPASLFGGTWERIAQGRMLLGMGAIEENHNSYWGTVTPAEVNPAYAGEMGGEAWHTLTVNELPAHTHTATVYGISSGNYTANAARLVYKDNTTTAWISEGLSWANSTGGNQPHSNMPPYLAVYMWKRVS